MVTVDLKLTCGHYSLKLTSALFEMSDEPAVQAWHVLTLLRVLMFVCCVLHSILCVSHYAYLTYTQDDIERLLEYVAIGPRFSNVVLQVSRVEGARVVGLRANKYGTGCSNPTSLWRVRPPHTSGACLKKRQQHCWMLLCWL